MNIILKTERLYLREIETTDDERMFEMDSDAEVYKFLGIKPIRNISQSQELIESIQKQYKENGVGRWAIIDKKTDEFVGWTGFKLEKEGFNGYQNFYDLRFRLLRKYWGKGFVTEATKAAIQYAFEKMDIEEIYSMTLIENEKSRHILEKLGFQWVRNFNFQGDEITWYQKINPDLI